MSKEIKFNSDCRTEILKGAKTIFDAVKVTYGAGGRSVVIAKEGDFPQITKDGVTVARAVTLKNEFQNLGVNCLKNAAAKTCEKAGDGTTASIILSYHFLKKCIEACDVEGFHPKKLKKGIDFAVKEVLSYLDKNKKPIQSPEELKNIALISSNGDEEISEMLSECFYKIGAEGFLEIQNSPSFTTSYEFVEGVSFNKSFVSPYFINDRAKTQAVLENPLIFIYSEKIYSISEIAFLMEKIFAEGKGQKILLICKDYSPDSIVDLVKNHIQGNFQICAVKTPFMGDHSDEFLEDIAVLTNAKVISKMSGRVLKTSSKNNTLDLLGKADRATVTQSHTTIMCKEQNPLLEERIKSLKDRLDNSVDENEKKALGLRISQLSHGVALIKVGGSTEIEISEKKDRVEDAMYAVKAAMNSGIVSGGGTALACAAEMLDSKLESSEYSGDVTFLRAIKIVSDTLKEPAKQLSENAGLETFSDEYMVEFFWHGLNLTTEKFEDLFYAGIIDPEAVIRESLLNASSVATTLMMCDASIVNEEKLGSDNSASMLRAMMGI